MMKWFYFSFTLCFLCGCSDKSVLPISAEPVKDRITVDITPLHSNKGSSDTQPPDNCLSPSETNSNSQIKVCHERSIKNIQELDARIVKELTLLRKLKQQGSNMSRISIVPTK